MQPKSARISHHPRSRARKSADPPQHPDCWQPPGHRSRGRAALPATPTPAPERRAAAAGRCTPRHSRGTLRTAVADQSPAAVAHPQGTSSNSTSRTPRWVPWMANALLRFLGLWPQRHWLVGRQRSSPRHLPMDRSGSGLRGCDPWPGPCCRHRSRVGAREGCSCA